MTHVSQPSPAPAAGAAKTRRAKAKPAPVVVPDLATVAFVRDSEAAAYLGLSVRSVQYLIEEGQLKRVYPRPRAARVTVESLTAYRAKVEAGQAAGAVKAAQVKAESEAKEQKRAGLLGKWGLGALIGGKGGD